MGEEAIHRHLDDIMEGGKLIYNNIGDKKTKYQLRHFDSLVKIISP